MSLEKPSPSPRRAEKRTFSARREEDPLLKILATEEDSDWEYAFMGAIQKPSTTASFTSEAEGHQQDLVKQDGIKEPTNKVHSTRTRVIVKNHAKENKPVEISNLAPAPVTEIQEFNVAVVDDVKPEGSFTLAAKVESPAPPVDDLWSQQFISGCEGGISPVKIVIYQETTPNPYQSIPLHIVEGRDDPEDEGICMTSPSPEISLTPPEKKLLVSKAEAPSASSSEKQLCKESPAKPDEFFEKCDILKWAIDDQDIGDMPGISCGPTLFEIPATVTSSSSSSVQLTHPQPTTDFFIQDIKEETTTDSVPPSTTTSTKNEVKGPKRALFQDNTPAEDTPKRKRGRPSRPQDPLAITPKLPRLPPGRNSDSEYAYVSDSGDILTDDEVSALKYRRMRDLNNIASKRCRQTRKEKMASTEAELQYLTERKENLKILLHKMEAKVKQLKSKFLAEMRNPSAKIAIARRRMVRGALGYDSSIIGAFMDADSEQLPDINTFWSI